MASDKLPPGWRRVRAGLYQHNDPFALVRQDNLGRWKVSINLRAPVRRVLSCAWPGPRPCPHSRPPQCRSPQ